MASQPEQNRARARDDSVSALVFMPCPACSSALRIAHASEASSRHDEFECPRCGARLVLAARS